MKPTASRSSAATIPHCEPMLFDLPAVDELTERLFLAGLDDDDDVILRVLGSLYPSTPEGKPIDWSRIGLADAACLCNLARRVAARVRFVLSTASEAAAESTWMAVGGESIGGGR